MVILYICSSYVPEAILSLQTSYIFSFVSHHNHKLQIMDLPKDK